MLFDGEELAGIHRVEWDGKDVYGNDVASGIYFYRLTSADYKSEKKMLLMK
jgi:flagellar hook assembly protein FlgD